MKHLLILLNIVIFILACSPKPTDIEFEQERYILEGHGATDKIHASAIDKNGKKIESGVDMTFFSPNRDIIIVNNDGTIQAVSSGTDTVEVDIVGADIKRKIDVRVKIASEVKTTHEKLRLWTGQVKEDVSAWVHSEKDAYIEDYLPTWTSDDPDVVSVESIPDPTGTQYQRSYVRLVGKKSGETIITATFRDLSTQISVSVFDEDEEVNAAGQRIPKDTDLSDENDNEDDDGDDI